MSAGGPTLAGRLYPLRAAVSLSTGVPHSTFRIPQPVRAVAEARDMPVRWSCRTGACHNCGTGLISGHRLCIDFRPRSRDRTPARSRDFADSRAAPRAASGRERRAPGLADPRLGELDRKLLGAGVISAASIPPSPAAASIRTRSSAAPQPRRPHRSATPWAETVPRRDRGRGRNRGSWWRRSTPDFTCRYRTGRGCGRAAASMVEPGAEGRRTITMSSSPTLTP